jgi:tetratricopeptide (TPR) repeat protein
MCRIRADQDSGALIVTQMLERLYFADVVLAEMTIPNGNVYYEVGIRHAAKAQGCVLLAADWSKPLFDIAQLRSVRYPLPEGTIADETARGVQDAIRAAVPRLAQGRSPMHDAIKGYPVNVDAQAASTMADQLEALAAFQASVRAVRLAPEAERKQRVRELVAAHATLPMTPTVAFALARLLKDSADTPAEWQALLDFVGTLPPELAGGPEAREHRAFALSSAGKYVEAIAELDALIATAGPTPERLGLLGGRYKRLLKNAASTAERVRYLDQAIQHYERGMELDLNDYYCSSNLPRLYRERQRRGDEERARSTLGVVIAACERALKRGAGDEWLRATLLGAAFDAGDADKAEELADQVVAEGGAKWKLETTLGDLARSAGQVTDPERRARLEAVHARLAPLARG